MNLITTSDQLAIFGARGMAGSAISRAFTRAGYSHQLTPTRSELDLLDAQAVRQWFFKYDPSVVVLAAAKVGGIQANNIYPADFLLENIKIQTNVIEAAWRCGVKRLLFLGSSCIYPKFARQPINEEELLAGPLEPTNEWYAIAKIAGIKLCAALRKQYDFDAVAVMPTNLYGPGDNYHKENSHVLPALIRRFHEAKTSGEKIVTCWGTGSPKREFLHVDDLGEACVHVLSKWHPGPEDPQFLNVGTGKDISIRDLAVAVAAQTGFDGEISWDTTKPDGTPKKQLEVSRLATLGWQARISLSDGLKSTVDDFRNQLNQNLLRL